MSLNRPVIPNQQHLSSFHGRWSRGPACTLLSADSDGFQLQTVYKHWLCAQFFHTTQMHCSNRIPCRKYCLEVQQRCPFILPDNDELIYGGSPSFICTGLQEDNPSDAETECCDVRWDSRADNSSKGTLKRTHPSCQHGTSLTSSAASRLCNSRLKLCLLVLVLLHTVATLTASHSPTGFNLTSSSSNEE
ncbi:transmembrane protein FAM155A-like [Labeo rohita]|uniref:Transmembrane protein FAM155A-like n=1 Tax=Labeo rohita TaxID=84645 RepID=A0A498LZY7_LABRO|nr:transmembrane protein FAM155A-like [Labeo rohita]